MKRRIISLLMIISILTAMCITVNAEHVDGDIGLTAFSNETVPSYVHVYQSSSTGEIRWVLFRHYNGVAMDFDYIEDSGSLNLYPYYEDMQCDLYAYSYDQTDEDVEYTYTIH